MEEQQQQLVLSGAIVGVERCIALMKCMSSPKIFGYSVKFNTHFEQKPTISLVAVPRIKKVGRAGR